MANKFTRNTKKISDIYKEFKEEALIIDSSYQRRKVWGIQDNIRLIETIILDLVIPEIFMWDCSTDPNTGKTITHIVDGQQRINAIFEFISGKYRLQSKYLIDTDIKQKVGNKLFVELDDELKKDIWTYELSIVNLNKNFSKDEIRNMFYRLNLTDYDLNEQEKRNSIGSVFGEISEELANEPFWQTYKVFSLADIRRMKDVEYSSSIILLAREGVVDQTKGDKLDRMYKDYCEEYKEAEVDLGKIHRAMDFIQDLTSGKHHNFANKKIQMYTLFSVMFDFCENSIPITEKMKSMFLQFVYAYSLYKNEYEIDCESDEEEQVVDMLKRYKLASSEGVNRLGNRMTRYELLKKMLLNESKVSENALTQIIEKMEILDAATEN